MATKITFSRPHAANDRTYSFPLAGLCNIPRNRTYTFALSCFIGFGTSGTSRGNEVTTFTHRYKFGGTCRVTGRVSTVGGQVKVHDHLDRVNYADSRRVTRLARGDVDVLVRHGPVTLSGRGVLRVCHTLEWCVDVGSRGTTVTREECCNLQGDSYQQGELSRKQQRTRTVFGTWERTNCCVRG